LLGADLTAENGRWKIRRIYTTESWNPGLVAPLAQPNLNVQEGHYILAVNGQPLTDEQDPYALLSGTARLQIVLLVNNKPTTEGAWTVRVQPSDNESALRQLAWIEDNRRKVHALSGGKLAYVWVPNTSGPGFNAFNRYYFAQQDKQGAVIDERFNGGGLLDDYMVDLMVRRMRAAITNEVPGGKPMRLPGGILGPKVLLVNELAGSGGDFFPWAFRQQKVGPLIGTRTWGGLVKSTVHYPFIDGGTMTAPDNAIFDPIESKWVAENQGVAPDIEQRISAVTTAKGQDLQLEKGVEEALKLLKKEPWPEVKKPGYATPGKMK
jgi:tricorn protease